MILHHVLKSYTTLQSVRFNDQELILTKGMQFLPKPKILPVKDTVATSKQTDQDKAR